MIDHRIHQFHFRAAAGWWVRAQGDKLTAADVTRCGITCCAWALGRNRAACLFPSASRPQTCATSSPPPRTCCLYLDKRTGRPLINDLTFTTQLYLASLYRGQPVTAPITVTVGAHIPGRQITADLMGTGWVLGFYPPAVVHLSQELMDKFLPNKSAMEASLMACPESVALGGY